MLSFFKKSSSKEKPTKQGSDSTVSSQELLDENEASAAEEEVLTELSIHPSMNISTEQQYVLRFLNNELTPLKPNQISLSGIDLIPQGGKVIVSAFVRNSLSKAVKFQNTTLLLLGPNGEKIGRKEFDLTELDELPARSSRPWNFVFEASDLFTTELPEKDWKLAFELKRKHALDLEEAWEKSLSNEDKQKLIKLVEKMEPPKQGEVNFLGLQAGLTGEQNLQVTMLIRNGSDKNIQLQQLPLQVEDATGTIVAKGGFKLDNLEVKANTSKPWTFIFPQSLLLKEEMDLSKWKAYPVQ
jgi:accessory Sec system S-layer assembly protein